MKFLLTCAGTAGHINPAIAIADKLREMLPDSEFLFIGSGRELENRLIPAAGYPLKNIKITGFSRSLSLAGVKANLKTAEYLAAAMGHCRKLLREFSPDIVIGTGGYVCYPVLMEAHSLKIPTLLHESNAVPGLTTKLLSGTTDKILVAFPEVSHQYHHPERVFTTGTPVRGGFGAMSREEARTHLGVPEGMPVVVSFWGSLGASVMNQETADVIALNGKDNAFYHIHATGGGEKGLQKMRDELLARGVTEKKLCGNTDLRPYIDNMEVVMTAADLVMCRAGASTMAELTAVGKPAVLVPSPNVTNNHQEKNALALQKAGGAVMVREKDSSGKLLYDTIREITASPEKLAEMSAAQRTLGVPDASERIAGHILSLIHS